jgi:hypothetical protein
MGSSLASRGRAGGADAKLHLDEIKGPLECPPESNVAKQCSAEWPKLRRELGLPEPDGKSSITGRERCRAAARLRPSADLLRAHLHAVSPLPALTPQPA